MKWSNSSKPPSISALGFQLTWLLSKSLRSLWLRFGLMKKCSNSLPQSARLSKFSRLSRQSLRVLQSLRHLQRVARTSPPVLPHLPQLQFLELERLSSTLEMMQTLHRLSLPRPHKLEWEIVVASPPKPKKIPTLPPKYLTSSHPKPKLPHRISLITRSWQPLSNLPTNKPRMLKPLPKPPKT